MAVATAVAAPGDTGGGGPVGAANVGCVVAGAAAAAVSAAVIGVAGLAPVRPRSRAVRSSTVPLAGMPLAFWMDVGAACVRVPNTPWVASGHPARVIACCSCTTAGPLAPPCSPAMLVAVPAGADFGTVVAVAAGPAGVLTAKPRALAVAASITPVIG